MCVLVPEATKATTTVLIIFAVLLMEFKGQNALSQCRSTNTTGLQVLQSSDNILGRYNVEVCASVPNIMAWKIILLYSDKSDPTYKNVNIHSVATEQVNLTCNNDAYVVCNIWPFDLMFDGCYIITALYLKDNVYQEYTNKIIYIHNNLTKQLVENNIYKIALVGRHSIIWISTYIPINSFAAELCQISDSDESCEDISQYCKRHNNALSVECAISPDPGFQYRAQFSHVQEEPYIQGGLITDDKLYSTRYFTISDFSRPTIQESSISWWVYLMAAVVFAAASNIGYCIIKKIKQKNKPHAYKIPSEETNESLLSSSCSSCILVVYASEDSPEGKALVQLFADNGAEVLDIQSARAVSAAAAAPGEWVSALVADRRVKLVLLHTRRAAQPYSDNTDGDITTLRTFGDSLAQFCWRRIIDDTRTQTPYNKYFLAKFPGAVESPIYDNVVKFTRFIISESAASLLLYTETISEVSAARGLDQFYTSIREWSTNVAMFDQRDTLGV